MTGQDGQRKVRVLEAHTLADCPDWESCWWQPHRMAAGLPGADQSLPSAPRDGLAVTVDDVRRAVGRLQAWLDDETASPTILGSILVPLLPARRAGLAGSDEAVEALAVAVHEAWMTTKRSVGVTSRLSETGEELMVPYAELSEEAKDLDRATVRAVLPHAEPVIATRVRAEAVAEERQRIIELVGDMCTYRERDGRALAHPHPADHLGPCPYGEVVQRILAADSVPVATPDGPPCCALHGRNCEQGGEECCGYCTESGHDFIGFRTGKHADGSNCSKRDQSPNTLPAAESSVGSAAESSSGVPQDGLVSWAELAEVMRRVSVSSVDAVRYAIIHHAERAAECRHAFSSEYLGGDYCVNCGKRLCMWCAMVGGHREGCERAADPSVGTGTPAATMGPERPGLDLRGARRTPEPAEAVSGGSGHAERQEERESADALLARLGTDAIRWVVEFVKVADRLADEDEPILDPMPGSWLHGWFCNAIEAGRTAGASESSVEAARYRAATEQLRAIALRFGRGYHADDPGAMAQDICDHFAAALGDGE